MREETKTNGDSPKILKEFEELIKNMEMIKDLLSKKEYEKAQQKANGTQGATELSYIASKIVREIAKDKDIKASGGNFLWGVEKAVRELKTIVETAKLLLSEGSCQTDKEKKKCKYEEAMEKSEEVAKALQDISKNKLREYFDQMKTLNTDVKMERKDLIKAKVEIKKLRARVHYDSARQGLGAVKDFIPIIDAFAQVMETWQDEKNMKDDLQGFCDFFECLVGYHYVHAKK